jgi:hypothetical protein
MKFKLTFSFLFIPFLILSQQELKIKGYVTDGVQPLENVNISIKNAAVGTITNGDGYYELTAFYTDKLIYSFQGKENQVFKVSDISTSHNVVLQEKINELDAVTVKRNSYRVRSQKALFDAYNIEKDIIKNKFQLLDKKTSGISLEIREGDEINTSAINILAVLQSMFSGVTISTFDGKGVIYMRGTNSLQNPTEAVYDVDGIVYTDPPLFLDINNIKRIARLPSLGGLAVYGTLGKGGVFIINTKTANTSPTKEHLAFRAKEDAKEVYDVKTIPHSQEKGNWPSYLNELYDATNFEEATAVYWKHKKVYQSSSYFVLDAVSYFLDMHAEKQFHSEIITNSKIMEKNSIELSRALGLMLEYYGDLEASRKVYLDVLRNWPHSPQAYLDLAQIFIKTKEDRKALRIIERYNRLVNEKLLTPELGASHDIFISEFEALAKKISNEPNAKDGGTKNKGDTRITMEWNDDQTAFIFQFVDPSKNFFAWDNSMDEEEGRYTNFPQIATGKEYFIPKNAENGMWQVNVNYLGNGRIKPTYLSTTVQYDYGLPSERIETYLHRLSIKGKVQELVKVRKNDLLVNSN